MVKNGKEVFNFYTLIHIFFVSFIINLFICIYSFYCFIDIVFFHSLQGSKLKIKKQKFFN